MILAELTAEVIKIAEEAGRIVLDSFQKDHAYIIKSDEELANDFATQADIASQELILSRLLVLRPNDIFIAEEDNTLKTKAVTSDTLIWHIDPIDGTANYSRGVEFFGISIAAVNAITDETVLGVVHAPALDRTWYSYEGKSFLNSKLNEALEFRTKVHKTAHLLAVAFSYDMNERSLFSRALPKLMTSFGDIRHYGSCALNLCFLAEGRTDAYIETSARTWDHKAGMLIARNAGVFTTIMTNPRNKFDSVVAAKTIADFNLLKVTLISLGL